MLSRHRLGLTAHQYRDWCCCILIRSRVWILVLQSHPDPKQPRFKAYLVEGVTKECRDSAHHGRQTTNRVSCKICQKRWWNRELHMIMTTQTCTLRNTDSSNRIRVTQTEDAVPQPLAQKIATLVQQNWHTRPWFVLDLVLARKHQAGTSARPDRRR